MILLKGRSMVSMKKQVYFNELLTSTLNSESVSLHPSSSTFEKIHDRIKGREKGNKTVCSRLIHKHIAAAACASLIITISILAASPKARAYAADIAANLKIKIFRLTNDDINRLKTDGKTIDINQMKDGSVENINGITIQKAGEVNTESPGAVLSKKLEHGVEIEMKIDSFNVNEKLKNELKNNSKTIDISGVNGNEDITVGGIKVEKSKK